MVEKAKEATKKTSKWIEDAWILVAAIASGCAAAGVATKAQIKTSMGLLPFWQIVTSIIIVVLAGFAWKLIHKKEQQ